MAKIRDLNPAIINRNFCGGFSRFDEFLNLLLNAVKIKAKEGTPPLKANIENFIKRSLFNNGAVGYDKVTERFYFVDGFGVNDYGDPLRLNLYSENLKTKITRSAYYDDDADGAYIIYALPSKNGFTMADVIRDASNFIDACNVAIAQNLEACKTPYIVVCKNKDLQLSFETALKQKQDGQAVILVSEELGEGVKAVNISVEYLADRFKDMAVWATDQLFNKFGIMTANDDKRERVQSAEVNATIGQATDYIYLLIDTFNAQTETYGIPYEMVLNGSLEEIYLKDDNKDESDANGDVSTFDVNEAESGKV